MSDFKEESLKQHKKFKGKITVKGKTRIDNQEDLSIFYTPGVAEPCREIFKDKTKVYDYTFKGNTVGIVSDGTRVLGLGDIGPEAALPVMEGKSLIMEQFANISAFPLCLDTKDEDEIVQTVKNLQPVFGAINLEDIEKPKVFRIQERLSEELDIPVFHDDKQGTAIVVLAALYNALKVLDKGKDVRIALVGAGSAGFGIANLLSSAGFEDVVVFDSEGALCTNREINGYKEDLTDYNEKDYCGSLEDIEGVDVLISASVPEAVPLSAIENMNDPNVVFSLANPVPEVSYEEAQDLGVDIYGSGRSDYPNQINNSLCFPGILRSLLDYRINNITDEMMVAAAKGIADSIEPTRDKVVPDMFNMAVVENIYNRIGEIV